MKIMIMTDMEGVAGIMNFTDWVEPKGRYYEKGKRLLTEEVNAAVAGFFDGGVEEILVVDGHGHGGIDPELLDQRVLLMQGHFPKVWPWGLDETFDGIAWVGQHAKAGTFYSHLSHTQSFAMVDISVNGISIGEYGQLALCAKELDVPCFFASGEKAFAEEAEALTPGIVTVSVKWGLTPDGLDHLSAEEYGKAKTSAIHLSPKRVRPMIRDCALRAAKRLNSDPTSFRFPELTPPYVRIGKFRKSGDRPAWESRAEHPDSLIELMAMPWREFVP